MISATNYIYNYYNIIPVVIIEIIIVYIFEYLVFIISINPGVISRINEALAIHVNSKYKSSMNIIYNDEQHISQISNSTNDETKYIKTQNTYGIVTFTFTIVGLLLLLLLYKYIVVNVMNKKIEWSTIGIVALVISVLIILMEAIYIFVIEHNVPNSIDVWDMLITINKVFESHLMKLSLWDNISILNNIPIPTNISIPNISIPNNIYTYFNLFNKE